MKNNSLKNLDESFIREKIGKLIDREIDNLTYVKATQAYGAAVDLVEKVCYRSEFELIRFYIKQSIKKLNERSYT